MELQNGSLIRVRVYGGEQIERRLIEVRGQTALVSTDEECKAAAKEKRDPICIGVPLADVIEELKEEAALI